MNIHEFDDRAVRWAPIEGLEHLEFYVYDVDEKNKIVDILFKFSANKQVMLHRHKSAYATLVIQGELRFYRPDGAFKEVRPTGSYVLTLPGGEPHREGGGDQDAIVFFSNRNVEGPMYEFLDDNLQPVMTFGIEDFKTALEAQNKDAEARAANAPQAAEA